MPHSSEKLTRRLVESLWVNWAISAGAITVVMLLALFVPKSWMPMPVFALAYFELLYMRRSQAFDININTSMMRVSVQTLFWSATAMLIINILNSRMLLDNYINWSNSSKENPFVTCLVIFPIMAFCSLWVILSRNVRNIHIIARIRQNAISADSGVVSALYRREANYQAQLMLLLSITMNVVEWWYYFQYYINVNMNTPDKFFFNFMPLAVYVLSLFFMWTRYQNLAVVIGPLATTERRKGVMVRYLIFEGDNILLSPNEFERWDTPAIAFIGRREATDEKSIRNAFAEMVGNEDFQTRFLYATSADNIQMEITHYAVFLPEGKQPDGWELSNWFTLDQIDKLLKSAQLSAELSDEIYRIFTITMAWKTYDREGKRLYPIKHYRPTFRLRDLKDWTVDYGDLSWLSVAEINQDRPFFRTRKLWHKITGSKI